MNIVVVIPVFITAVYFESSFVSDKIKICAEHFCISLRQMVVIAN